jgi:myo-inositol 2-dehydrogenase/D-chiro-inositol 1-dehydrogenase
MVPGRVTAYAGGVAGESRGRAQPRIGLIGCGAIAGQRHLPALRGLGARVVAIADSDHAALARTADANGIERRHSSAEALIADPQVDCIGVLVPPQAHPDVAVAALEAGKDVLVEKPLALTPEDCDRMVQAAERSERVAMVAHNLRFHRFAGRARELIAAGAIGEPEAVSTLAIGEGSGRPGAWLKDSSLGGGVITEKGVHHYDLWRFLCAGSATRVFAHAVGDAYDRRAVISATVGDRVLAQTLAGYGAVPAAEVVVAGSHGQIELDLYAFDGIRVLGPGEVSGSPRRRLANALASLRSLPRGLADLRRGGAYVISYAEEWRHFLECVRMGRQPLSPFADGREAALVAIAAHRSIREGAAVQLEELRPAVNTGVAGPG